MKCNFCGSHNSEGAKFCKNCGSPLNNFVESNDSDDNFKVCPSCHKKNAANNKFCTECGTSLTQPDNVFLEIECKFCGTKNLSQALFCKKCGASLQKSGKSDSSDLEIEVSASNEFSLTTDVFESSHELDDSIFPDFDLEDTDLDIDDNNPLPESSESRDNPEELEVLTLKAKNTQEALKPSEKKHIPNIDSIGNKYRVVKILKQSPLGDEFVCIDPENSSRLLLLKKLPFSVRQIDERKQQHLFNLTQELLSLSHPNIAKFEGIFRNKNEIYFVQEYVNSKSLLDVLNDNDGKFSPKGAYIVANKIKNAVMHAHKYNISHVFLNPHNVRILFNGEIKIINFGIERIILQVFGYNSISLTKEELLFLDPSQKGKPRNNILSDIYSFGLLIYEMLTGEFFNTGIVKKSAKIPDIFASIIENSIKTNPKLRFSSMNEIEKLLSSIHYDFLSTEKLKNIEGEVILNTKESETPNSEEGNGNNQKNQMVKKTASSFSNFFDSDKIKTIFKFSVLLIILAGFYFLVIHDFHKEERIKCEKYYHLFTNKIKEIMESMYTDGIISAIPDKAPQYVIENIKKRFRKKIDKVMSIAEEKKEEFVDTCVNRWDEFKPTILCVLNAESDEEANQCPTLPQDFTTKFFKPVVKISVPANFQ